jgi:hypothetical protein
MNVIVLVAPWLILCMTLDGITLTTRPFTNITKSTGSIVARALCFIYYI